MGYTKRTINVEELVAPGSRCANPVIVWDEPLCAGISCKRNNGREIDVVIPDECEEKCFWVTYTCTDYCTTCEPIRLKICPCDVDTDCESCHECHPVYNVCVSMCEDNEFCTDHNTCVECDETHPCENGKQCVGGQCECPPEKPYVNDDGICAPCTNDSCPEGEVCTPDGCQPPVCPSGHWHTGKMKCVQCLNTGHCDPGECCQEDNSCACCPGFVRDPATGQCVSAPCAVDTDCPDCTYCQTGVGCVPVVCPDGKVCIPGQGCVPECNCSNPNCASQSAACVAYSSTTCYCKECSGSCASGQPCGEGCYCDENFQCQPNPCSNKSCEDGTECGQGCGCNKETNKCEPCSKAACGDECNNLLGCDCPNGTSCQDVQGCNGPCDAYGGCPLDCTCVGGMCVPCADFSCETSDCSDRPECRCAGERCEGDPDFCKDVFVGTNFDCGLTAELTLKDGCMCPGITAYVTPFGIFKDGTTVNRQRVSLAIRLAKGVASNWAEIKQLHLLDETQYQDIADNDTPISGTIDVVITEFYQSQVWVNGNWVNQGGVASRVLSGGGSISFAGIARKEDIQFVTYKIGSGVDVITNVSQNKIVRYEVTTKVNQLTFDNNCVYGAEDAATIRLDSGTWKSVVDSLYGSSVLVYIDTFIRPTNGNYDLGSKFVTLDNISSDSKRDPLFVWYRSHDNVYIENEIIRKLYIKADSSNYYKDSLFGPENFSETKQNLVSPEGRVFGDMFYKVTNDCACNDKTIDFGRLTWCSPDSLAISSVTLSLCNKKVVITSDIGRPCVTNWDLREFDLHPLDNILAFKKLHQAKYHLMIELEDGTKIDRAYTWRETGVSAVGLYSEADNTSIRTYSQTFTSAIVSLKMELRYGSSTEIVCEWDKTIVPPTSHTPAYSRICDGSNNIKYRFQLAPNHIVDIVATGGTVVSGSGYKEIIAVQGTPVTAYFTFSDYCPLTLELNEFCCDSLAISFQANQVAGSGSSVITELTSIITGGTLPYSVKYYRQLTGGTNELVGESTNSGTAYKVILTNPTPGLYFATVNDGSGSCSKNSAVASIEPRNQDDYAITITPAFSGCTYTGNVSISIPNEPDIVGSKIYYKINTAAPIYFTVTNQMVTNGYNLIPATGQTITLVSIEIPNQSGPPTTFTLTGSATVPSNLSEAIPVVSTFLVNSSATSTNVCAGSDVLIEITGTPNAIVQIGGIEPINLDGIGYGVSTQNPVTTSTYTITGITNAEGTCPGTQGLGLTRQASVTPMPTITIISDVCDGTGTFRTVTFSNITSATDQLGNPLTVVGSTVTVNVNTVTEIRAVYVLGLCSAPYTHIVTVCGAPVITGTVSGPDVICYGETATITTSGVTGGTAPYSYNYYTGSDYNELYVLNQTSKIFALTTTETIYVRVMDSLGNIAMIGNKTVVVATTVQPDIVPITGQIGVEEVYGNVYEIEDTVTDAVFKTAISYSTYNWSVAGTYGGTTSGSGSTFTIDPSLITGTIELTVTVTTENGCSDTETVSMYVVAAADLLAADEILFSTNTYKLFKVALSTSSIGVPVLLCGSGNPALGITLRSNGQLIGIQGNNLHQLNPLSGCTNSLIGGFSTVTEGIGMLNADKVIGQTQDRLRTYDLTTDTVNTNHYTISDGSNVYSNAQECVRIGTYLYTICTRSVGGIFQDRVLLRFTLDGSDAVTAFSNRGILPNIGGSPTAMAYDGSDAYLIFSDGKVYNLNLTTPSSSTLIGTILVPSGEPIIDATNNF